MGAMLLAVFGGLALLLASLGIYGVLAFSISRRTREIGIRMALGADRRRVFLLVVREGMWLVGVGIAIGLAEAWPGRGLSPARFTAYPRPIYRRSLGPSPFCAAVALVACAIPARRAIRVNPITALRQE